MNRVLLGVWQNAPVWVWPLFIVLLLVGLMAMKTRNSSTIPYFIFPSLGLSAVGAVTALVHVPTNWIAFGCSYLIGVARPFGS